MKRKLVLLVLGVCVFVVPFLEAHEKTFRLYYGITLYVVNDDGRDFDINLELKDINVYANGPREVLFKVYDPDGGTVVREFIPDDGVSSQVFLDRIGGWDHEMMYYANLYAKGTKPAMRFSAWSDPARLKTIKGRSFKRTIKTGKKGIYRILLAGTPDHFVTLNLSPELKYGVCGHPSFIYGDRDLFRKTYIYVPKDTCGLFFIMLEPDMPRERVFTLKSPTGDLLYQTKATGGYCNTAGGYGKPSQTDEWKQLMKTFQEGKFDGKVLTFEVSPGKNDYLMQLNLQQPRKGAFKQYVGMGSQAVLCPDEATARAIQGGTRVVDGLVFWHPFQVKFYQWLKQHPLDKNEEEKKLRAELEKLYGYFRQIETGDGPGSYSWKNWAYAFGYYGCKIWRPSWLLMKDKNIPEDLKKIIREGLMLCGDRLSMACGLERVNGNAFSQIPVELWYCYQATKDPLHKKRLEVFWDRWAHNQGWGPGAGLSRSGDSQEHFAHDCGYGSYLMDNWIGKTWVKHGILNDAKGIDDRFEKIVKRYRELYSYLYCPEANANPWSSRTHNPVTHAEKLWEPFGHPWKGKPGPDFTVNVNNGNEWFAARRKNYYFLSFHGKLAPEWMSETFEGQLGFGGGIICQLTVPGKGTVLASTLNGSYGHGMHPSNWRNFHIHSVVGERWDGHPVIAAISEHQDTAKLEGDTVSSSGEIRNAHLKITRSYTFKPDRIICSLALAESDYAQILSIYSHQRQWSEMKLAYEMIPFITARRGKKALCKVTLFDQSGKSIGEISKDLKSVKKIRIERDNYGVDIALPKEMPVKLGDNNTVLIQLTSKLVKADTIKLTYELIPFINLE